MISHFSGTAAAAAPVSEGSAPAAPSSKAAENDLEARGVTKTFAAGASVFSDVTFDVPHGASVALVGANGAGKSTLLRCALGLIRPDAGQVRLFGHDMARLRGRKLRTVRAQVGLVAQRHNLSLRMSVLSNVLHGLLGSRSGPRYWWQSLAPAEARNQAMNALEMVGLADLASRRADRLSGGQSQRVAIARALVCSPRLLVADEPAASLDPAAGEEMMALFFRLMKEQDVTVLFTSHHINHALSYADRIVGLRDGTLSLNAETKDLDATELGRLYA